MVFLVDGRAYYMVISYTYHMLITSLKDKEACEFNEVYLYHHSSGQYRPASSPHCQSQYQQLILCFLSAYLPHSHAHQSAFASVQSRLQRLWYLPSVRHFGQYEQIGAYFNVLVGTIREMPPG